MTTATLTSNSIEDARLKVGLTKPQMLRLLTDNPDHVAFQFKEADKVFGYSDKDISAKLEGRADGKSSLVTRAVQISDLYDEWVDEVLARLRAAADVSEDGFLRTRDVARILGISDFHLSQVRIRGQVEGVASGTRRYLYTYDQVAELVKANSEALTSEMRKSRGPIANGFLAWLSDRPVEALSTTV